MKDINLSKLLLLDDPHFIIFSKPSGWLSQSGAKDKASLHSAAEKWCGHPLKVIHRLDRPSSGIIIYAKDKKAAMMLSRQWKDRSIKKYYLAVTPKSKSFEEGIMEDLLWHNKKKNKSYSVEFKDDGAKEAVLHYKKLGEIEHYQLLQIELITGRHHQIRCQLSARNLPVKGDVKYGARRGNKDRSIHLHAWKLSFLHPEHSKEIHLQTPPELNNSVWAAFDRNFPAINLKLTRAYL